MFLLKKRHREDIKYYQLNELMLMRPVRIFAKANCLGSSESKRGHA